MSVTPPSLEALASHIKARMKAAEGHRVSAGVLLLEAKQRVAAGEAGEGISWWDWCDSAIQRSHRDINKLLQIAVDPSAAERERQDARERMEKTRKRSDDVAIGANVRPERIGCAPEYSLRVREMIELWEGLRFEDRQSFRDYIG